MRLLRTVAIPLLNSSLSIRYTTRSSGSRGIEADSRWPSSVTSMIPLKDWFVSASNSIARIRELCSRRSTATVMLSFRTLVTYPLANAKCPFSSDITIGSPTMICESVKEKVPKDSSFTNVYLKRLILGVSVNSTADPGLITTLPKHRPTFSRSELNIVHSSRRNLMASFSSLVNRSSHFLKNC